MEKQMRFGFYTSALLMLIMAAQCRAGEFSVTDFGAVGDGKTDASRSFIKTLKAAVDHPHAIVRIPAGEYLLNHCVQVAFRGAVDNGLAIEGDGQGVTVIRCANTNGAFSIRSELCQSMVSIRDLTLVADLAGAGTAIEVTSSLRGVRNYRTLTVENVDMRGSGLPTRKYFNRGLKAHAQWRPLFRNVIFGGMLDPALKSRLHAKNVQEMYFDPEYAFCADWCYAPSFQHCYAWSCHTGYRLVSHGLKPEGPEDSAFYRCFAVEVVVGIDIDTPIIEPQLVIDSCHINSREVGLRISNRKFFHIVNSLFYTLNEIEYPYVDIELQNCWAGFIHGNMFHSPHPDNMKTHPRSLRTCIALDNRSRNIMISGNTFNGKGKAFAGADEAAGITINNNMIINRHVEKQAGQKNRGKNEQHK